MTELPLKELIARLQQINEEKTKLKTEFNEIALELWNRIPSINEQRANVLEKVIKSNGK